MKYPILVLFIMLMSGCSARWHLKRAQHHINKAEQKGASIDSDTVFIEKEVFVPEIKTDTVFESQPGDTVTIEKEKLTIKYVKLPGDKVYIEGKVKSDTVIVKVPHQVVTNIEAPPCPYRWWHILVGFLIGLVVGVLFGKIFLR